MTRWWPFGKKEEEVPVGLPEDPAHWSLGEPEEQPRILALLLQELASPAPSRRERAVELLAEAGTTEAVQGLIAQLRRETNLVVRWKLLHALYMLEDAPAVGQTLSQEEVHAWKEEVIEGLLWQLRGETAGRRWGAAEGLGQLGDPRALPALVEALRDPHAFVRWAAAQAIGQIGEQRAVSLLLPLLQEKDPLVRRSAVDALAHFNTEEVRRALRRMLHDPDPSVRRNAIDAIARLSDPAAIDALILALDPQNEFWVRYSAAEALGIVGDHRAVPPLIEASRDPRPLLRRAVVSSLGLLRDSRAIPTLLQALEDEDAQVRLHAADGLARIGHEGVLPHLEAHRDDPASIFGRTVGQAVERAIVAIQQRTPRD